MLPSPPTEETNLVSLELLKQYLDIGFILVPLFQNSVHLNIDGLVTDAEWESLPGDIQIEGRYKGDLSGKRPRKNLLALYHLSDKFWTYERLEKEHHRFFGVATLLGKSPKKDPIDGSDLYTNGLDPDSEDLEIYYLTRYLLSKT